MILSDRLELGASLKFVVHSLGVVALLSLIGTPLGAVVGTALDAADLGGEDTGTVAEQFTIIAVCGITGAAAGSAISAIVLTFGAFVERFRVRMASLFERASGALTIAVAQCGGYIALSTFLLRRDLADTLDDTYLGNLVLLALLGASMGLVFGVVIGMLGAAVLVAAVLVQVLAGFLGSTLTRARPTAAATDLADTMDDPWPIRTAATLMPSAYGRRWRDDFAEARYDYDRGEHPRLLRDYLLHAPAAIAWAWIATLRCHFPGATNTSGRR
ncbi:hypothetical protein AGRA3207_003743 [Actinomadura graeca]|uniref:Uncharacterized protein n=1 Tax=Actinomadura graeca TaxID=2750812 RepID=A0ABX8QVD4_9ACTN|nr:hypothetical protein [Actinomadura graeca]QXJ22695.1 hypothetical protein AGRA3207_003743 [Actinomadura graeca]